MFNILTKRNGLIGVDIGAGCVKVAQLTRRSGRYVLSRGVVLDRRLQPSVAPNGDDSFSVNDVGELLLACEHFSGRSAATVMSMSACEVKSERLESDLATTEVEKLASRIADRDICLPGTMQHDYWRTQCNNRDDTLHVLATSKQLTQDVAKQHRNVGWACTTMDGLPQALARAVSMTEEPKAPAIAAIDWGWSQVTVCVVQNGEPLFVRSFRHGALAKVVEPLCQELRLSRHEASRLLSQTGISGQGHDSSLARTVSVVAKHASAGIQQFEQEVGRTLEFVASRHRNISPAKIVLFGGGAMIGNIAADVGQKFGRQAEVWSFPAPDEASNSESMSPVALLGPAIALSALSWERS